MVVMLANLTTLILCRALDFLCNRLKVPHNGGEGAMELIHQRTRNVLPLTSPLGDNAGDGIGLEDCEVVILAPKGTAISVQNAVKGKKQLVGVSTPHLQISPVFHQSDSQPTLDDAESSVVTPGKIEHMVQVRLKLNRKCEKSFSNQTSPSHCCCCIHM